MQRGPVRGNSLDSQLVELLAELPGVGSDLADCVVAEVKLLQSQQAVQPPLVHLRQVVVVQLPKGRGRGGTKIRLFLICEGVCKGISERSQKLILGWLTELPCC